MAGATSDSRYISECAAFSPDRDYGCSRVAGRLRQPLQNSKSRPHDITIGVNDAKQSGTPELIAELIQKPLACGISAEGSR